LKKAKLVTVDGISVDFLSISEPDGPEIECYSSDRMYFNKPSSAEIAEFNIDDDKVDEFVADCVNTNSLKRTLPGTFDFVT